MPGVLGLNQIEEVSHIFEVINFIVDIFGMQGFPLWLVYKLHACKAFKVWIACNKSGGINLSCGFDNGVSHRKL